MGGKNGLDGGVEARQTAQNANANKEGICGQSSGQQWPFPSPPPAAGQFICIIRRCQKDGEEGEEVNERRENKGQKDATTETNQRLKRRILANLLNWII